MRPNSPGPVGQPVPQLAATGHHRPAGNGAPAVRGQRSPALVRGRVPHRIVGFPTRPEQQVASHSNAKVLVVSSVQRPATSLSASLQQCGFEVVADTNNAEQAVALVASLTPDVLLVDLDCLDVASRVSLIRLVRSRYRCAVVAATARANVAKLDCTEAASPHGIVALPAAGEMLSVSIRLALNAAHRAAKAAGSAHTAHGPDREFPADLPGRLALDEQFVVAVARAVRNGTRFAVGTIEFAPVGLLEIDADSDLLIEAAARLRATLRQTDLIARIDRLELAFLAEEVDQTALATVGSRVVGAFADPLHVNGQAVSVGSSAGLALWQSPENGIEQLLQAARYALHEAKRHDGSQWRSAWAPQQAQSASQVEPPATLDSASLPAGTLVRRALGWASLAAIGWLLGSQFGAATVGGVLHPLAGLLTPL